ncbi:hypothetical protein [Actinomadura sp. 7K507]|uniref:hypothetical protein n=1 Tax=Actinomadura sp. 7K507 TaxID=2530365 RepID=UPI0010469CE8|nr:hypothetical protein [Actinomadura sp. 7K507]TDC75011.1 hypothetical protein E1285_42135 [Actinomadura sp. 7K507]
MSMERGGEAITAVATMPLDKTAFADPSTEGDADLSLLSPETRRQLDSLSEDLRPGIVRIMVLFAKMHIRMDEMNRNLALLADRRDDAAQ